MYGCQLLLSVCWTCVVKWSNLHQQSEAPGAHQDALSAGIRWQKYGTLSIFAATDTKWIIWYAPVVAAHRPWPVRNRLRSVQSFCLSWISSKPGWRVVGSVIRNWLGHSWLNRSSFQASCADQSELSIVDHIIGCLDGNRISGWPNMLLNTGRLGCCRIFSTILPDADFRRTDAGSMLDNTDSHGTGVDLIDPKSSHCWIKLGVNKQSI